MDIKFFIFIFIFSSVSQDKICFKNKIVIKREKTNISYSYENYLKVNNI